jgi:iron complex outermembrane recepter protein
MHKPLLFLAIFLSVHLLHGQDSTTTVLPALEVQAYRYNRSLLEVPVAVGLVKQTDLERFDNSSFLSAVNTLPGVRMEERSPGSYRFSIRGSLIRSPFGVRNVKVYWNGLPITDGGGNTYLNLLDLSSIGRIEVIKGPGSSLYGASTGGVVLMKSRLANGINFELSDMIGSYGLHRFQARAEFSNGKNSGAVNYAHQSSDGYRVQTAFRRDAGNVDLSFSLNKSTILTTTIFATDVYYETPGGLTKAEYDANAIQARPAAGPFKSAVEQNASVRNKSIFGGLNLIHDWNKKWSSQVGIFSSYNDFENYAIRNYEHRYETNIGGRLENQFSFGDEALGGKISFGGEAIYFASPIHVFQNNSGVVGDKQIDDDVISSQYLVFAQGEIFLPYDFSVTIGASSNYLNYDFERTIPAQESQEKSFSAVITPRIALLKNFGDHFAVFSSISKGFSPPTLAEVRPSANTFNQDLKPENGISYEAGFKGSVENFTFDASVYQFNLKETIVLQRVVDGSEFFTNSGETVQKGVEILASVKVLPDLKIWSSYTYNHYRFKDYIKYDPASQSEIDYSGNKMTGVPTTLATIGLDLDLKKGFYFNATNSYTDHIPLNDSNSEFASEYFLISLRAGHRKTWSEKFATEFFAGVNNLLDQKYSLGNDLNAPNGRYYNVASDRNFFLGVKLNFHAKK